MPGPSRFSLLHIRRVAANSKEALRETGELPKGDPSPIRRSKETDAFESGGWGKLPATATSSTPSISGACSIPNSPKPSLVAQMGPSSIQTMAWAKTPTTAVKVLKCYKRLLKVCGHQRMDLSRNIRDAQNAYHRHAGACFGHGRATSPRTRGGEDCHACHLASDLSEELDVYVALRAVDLAYGDIIHPGEFGDRVGPNLFPRSKEKRHGPSPAVAF